MPLPCVASGQAKRCTAMCKARGSRCRNPAAWGCTTCRFHGARHPLSIRQGRSHWNYQGAGQTTVERQERHNMAVFFHETELLLFELGMIAPGSARTPGRKPKPSSSR